MNYQAKSVRTFIGAKDYELSRNFYKDLSFQEIILSHNMCYFKIDASLGFYLQDAYVKDWINNSMIFLEVENLEQHYKDLLQLELHKKYQGVKLLPIRNEEWGSEFFLHDPSGVLWHIGAFNN